MKVCIKCSQELPPNAIYCPACGKKQMKTSVPNPKKRSNGTGTVYKLKGRRRRPWVAAIGLILLGCYETQTEAFQALEAVRMKGGISNKYNATLEDIYLDWCASYFTPDTSTKTREEKETAWLRLAALADCKMRELKTSDYRSVIESAMTIQRRRKDGTSLPAKPLGKSGKDKIRKLASQLCQHAMKDDIIDKNYALLVDVPDGDVTQKETFTTEHQRILWKHADRRTVQIILCLIYTGLRINELFSIQRDRVFLDKHYMIGGFKTVNGRDRFIPISQKIAPFMESFYEESTGGAYLIINSRGSQMNDTNFREREFYPTLEELGIIEPPQRDEAGHLLPRTITPHSTRYTFFNMARASGADPDMLTLVMGHDNHEESMAMYGKLTEEDKDAIKRLVNII